MPIHPDLQALLAGMPALDYADYSMEELRALSAATPSGAPGPALASTEERQVNTPDGPRTVRIHHPLGDGPKPTVVFIHGGGWVVGTPSVVTGTTERIAAYLGAVVVSISYRLAPEHPFPAAFDDAIFLTRWAFEHISEFGGSPEAFAIAGESAGGNLAAAIALALREDGILAGQLLLNPATDLSSHYRESASYQDDNDPALTAASMDFSIRSYLGEEYTTEWRASPASADDVTGAPPAVIGISGYDPLRDDGLAYAAKLSAAGVAAEAIAFEDLIHAYAAQSPLVPAAHWALVDTLEKFRTLMGWAQPDPRPSLPQSQSAA